jgi:hypothetical protein
VGLGLFSSASDGSSVASGSAVFICSVLLLRETLLADLDPLSVDF